MKNIVLSSIYMRDTFIKMAYKITECIKPNQIYANTVIITFFQNLVPWYDR